MTNISKPYYTKTIDGNFIPYPVDTPLPETKIELLPNAQSNDIINQTHKDK